MELKDLFVSHKQVQPVSFSFQEPDIYKDPYLNFDRASRAAARDSSVNTEDMSTWKVGDSDDQPILDWRVKIGYPNKSDYNTRLREFIIGEEGFRDKAYKDGKYYSIGYGFNDPKYKEGDVMTREEADAELTRQLQTREAKYKQRFGSKWENLTDNQRIALMSYGYNTGDENIIRGDVAKYLDNGDMVRLRDSIRINTFQGNVLDALEERRKRERALFDS